MVRRRATLSLPNANHCVHRFWIAKMIRRTCRSLRFVGLAFFSAVLILWSVSGFWAGHYYWNRFLVGLGGGSIMFEWNLRPPNRLWEFGMTSETMFFTPWLPWLSPQGNQLFVPLWIPASVTLLVTIALFLVRTYLDPAWPLSQMRLRSRWQCHWRVPGVWANRFPRKYFEAVHQERYCAAPPRKNTRQEQRNNGQRNPSNSK